MNPLPSTPMSADVLVIGAGASGIEAARTVASAGRSVIVLEARDRIGGRLWTDRTSMSVPIERGAELIHGSTVSTWDTVRGQSITTHPLTGRRGRRNPDSPWLDQDSAAYNSFPHGTPPLERPLPEPRPAETAEKYLDRLGITPDNVPLALKAIEVDAEQFPVLPAADLLDDLQGLLSERRRQPTSPPQDRDFRVLGGYDQVLEDRAKHLPIHLETVVLSVKVGADSVEIVTEAGPYTGRVVIVAVPAGVLQAGAISFEPALPVEQAAALASVAYLPVFKAVMEFAEPILPAGVDLLEDYSLAVPSFWNASAGVPDYPGQVVVGWATGDNARRLRALSETEQRRELVDALSTLTAKKGIEPVALVHHDWESDPFSRGSYPGREIDPESLYQPLAERVFWAGMITDTIDESTDTGRRAARAALHRLD